MRPARDQTAPAESSQGYDTPDCLHTLCGLTSLINLVPNKPYVVKLIMPTAFLTHPACLKHEMGADHPESPARLHAIEDQLIATGLLPFLAHHLAPEVTREQLLRVHGRTYVESVFALSPQAGLVYLDGDTAMNPYTLDAALHAAGAAVQAVDMVMAGQAENAFCNIRPPGHHAGRDSAAGFCIFNNVVGPVTSNHPMPSVQTSPITQQTSRHLAPGLQFNS